MQKGQKETTPFELLCEKNTPWAARLLFLAVADPVDGEDLLETVFLRIAHVADGGSVSRSRIAQELLSALRRHSRRTKLSTYEPLEESAESNSLRGVRRLARAWKMVPRNERLALSFLTESMLPVPEIAALFRMSEESLRRRFSRGLRCFAITAGSPVTNRIQWNKAAAAHLAAPDRTPPAELGSVLEALRRVKRHLLPTSRESKIRRRLLSDIPGPGPTVHYDSIVSPLGPIWVGVVDGVVVRVSIGGMSEEEWIDDLVPRIGGRAERNAAMLDTPCSQLGEYLRGARDSFTFPFRLLGVTQFQTDVLAACAEVPYGSVSSYKRLARAVGRPRATRAVGGALGGNPLPILIPCHRILSSAGRLHGFSGGVDLKEKLLAIEGHGTLFALGAD